MAGGFSSDGRGRNCPLYVLSLVDVKDFLRSGSGGGQNKNPAPQGRGASTTYCRKQDLKGPGETNLCGAALSGRGAIVRPMAHGALFTIGANARSRLLLRRPGSP